MCMYEDAHTQERCAQTGSKVRGKCKSTENSANLAGEMLSVGEN